jgi:hypothetical protein
MCLAGWAVAALWLAGHFGIGNFAFYYGPEEPV